MSKMIFSARQADNYFAQVKRAWKALEQGDHVQFVNNVPQLTHGKVKGVWLGLDPRLVVVDDFGRNHYFRTLDGVMVLANELGAYIPATEYGNLRVAH